MKMDQSLRARSGLQLNPNINQARANGRIDLNDPVDMNLARLTVKDVVYAKCNVYYAAKNNTIQNEFTVTVSGPRATKYGFDWWIMLLVFINIIVFGLLVWRALALALPLIKDIRMRRASVKAGAGSDENAKADLAVSGADETPYAAYGASETAAAGEEQPEPQPEETEKAEAEASEAEASEAEEDAPVAEAAEAAMPAPSAVVIPAPAAAPSDPTVRAEMDAMHEQIAELTRKVDALTAALAAKKPTAAQRNAEKRKELSDQMKNMDDKLSAINEMLSAMTRDRGADGSGASDRKKK